MTITAASSARFIIRNTNRYTYMILHSIYPCHTTIHHKQREVDDMIWEVDENLDGCVDWEEFLLMFRRNVSDVTGLEPFQLFNMVQFCMYDKEFTGFITVDQTMQMLYARFGKERLEAEIKVCRVRCGTGSRVSGEHRH